MKNNGLTIILVKCYQVIALGEVRISHFCSKLISCVY